VDGTNGDVILEKVTTTLLHTAIAAKGGIRGTPNGHGKTTSLDFSVKHGRIQDFLRLFVHRPTPAVTGTTSLTAHVTVPPEGRPFLQELRIDGDFDIDEGHFTSEDTQKQIDNLSESARGQKPEESQEGPPENVISGLQGHVHLRDGTATLTNFSLWVPGAHAKVSGTYNLINDKIDFHGILGTDVKLSQTTSGFKSVLLKPFDSLFKGRKRAAVVPVKLTGTYPDPQPGFDMLGKGKEAAHRPAPPAQ
jgi:AsmA-like C-terminal region